MTKEEYILKNIEALINYYKDDSIKASDLSNLINQWSFDYDMEKKYRPEILKK